MRTAKRCYKTSGATSRFYMQYNSNGDLDYIAPVGGIETAKCCEIWMCDLHNSGSVQSGLRPVFILSNNKNNEHSTVLNVIPMTTKINKRNLPCHVVLENYEEYGLMARSTIMVEQTMAINKSDLRFKIGAIMDKDTILKICAAMKAQFPILNV